MSEMAKYLKKRRISLHDIIFKNRKGSREESKKELADDRVVVQVVTDRGASGNASYRKCTSPESGRCFIRVSSSATGDQTLVDRSNPGCAGAVVGDAKHNLTLHDYSGRMASRRIDSGSGENSSGSDRSELKSPSKSDSDTSEENYIMSRYFKSMTLSDDENPPPSSRLGLPTIDTGSSRSLSAIPWSEMKKDTPLSRSCYEICSNKTPGTSCGGSCSTSFARPKQGKSQVSYWSNTGSENDIIIPLSSSVMTEATARMKRQSRREMLSPLNLGKLQSSIRNASRGSLKKEPSSLHVSPNRSPNMSGNPTPSPSSVMSGETLPPAFSPFAAYPVLNHHHALRHSSAVMRPFHDHNLLPLRPSSSNPTINHATDSLQHTIQSRFLRPIESNLLTRSNPNLYVSSPPDIDSSPRSLSPLSSCGFSPSTSTRSQLSPAPIPIPPSSPRPSSRCRRTPRVKKADTEYQHNFDNF